MAFTLWNLFEAILLVLNAICILHEERFLAKMGWNTPGHLQGFGEVPSAKSQIINLIYSIRTVMRDSAKKNLMQTTTTKSPLQYTKLIDCCARLYDLNFYGFYNLKQVHGDDYEDMLKRSRDNGVQKIIIPAGSLFESVQAQSMAQNDSRIYHTVGCHPRNYYKEYRDLIYKTTNYPQELANFYLKYKGTAVAFGEFGLDYDRLYLCSKQIQKEYFKEQLEIALTLKAPLYLECKNAFDDFMDELKPRNMKFNGVVQSFKGSVEEGLELVRLGLHLGINGSNFKTQDRMDVLKKIPRRRIIIGTNSPNDEVSPTYEGFKYVMSKFENVRRENWKQGAMVKFRNEPARVSQVLEMYAAVREMSPEDMEKIMYDNANILFFKNY